MAAASLDFSGKEQLYYQIYDILFQDIVNGVYAVGDLIPSETELMNLYGVSRATARRAMEMLSNNGLIVKRRGRGSEVVSNHPNTSPGRVTSYIKKNVEDKVAAQKNLIDAQIVPADAQVAALLEVPEGTELYRLCRVRYSGDKPFYCEINYLPSGLVPGILKRDFSKESLRAYLFNELHITWARAKQRIYSVPADADIARLLQTEEGDPLMFIERLSYGVDERPGELVQTYYRADLYHLELQLDV